MTTNCMTPTHLCGRDCDGSNFAIGDLVTHTLWVANNILLKHLIFYTSCQFLEKIKKNIFCKTFFISQGNCAGDHLVDLQKSSLQKSKFPGLFPLSVVYPIWPWKIIFPVNSILETDKIFNSKTHFDIFTFENLLIISEITVGLVIKKCNLKLLKSWTEIICDRLSYGIKPMKRLTRFADFTGSK